MALLLPAPTTAREEAADALIRSIEVTNPIVRGAPAGPWLSQMIQRRERPEIGVEVALCAMSRILRALPETNVSAQWAFLALVAETPIGAYTGGALYRLDFVRIAMQNLHQFATGPVGYTLAQLQSKAREVGNPLVNESGQPPVLTLEQVRAFRAGFSFWKARIT